MESLPGCVADRNTTWTHEVSTAEKVSFVGAKTKKYGGDTSVFPLHQGFYGMPSRFEKRKSGFINPKSKMWQSS